MIRSLLEGLCARWATEHISKEQLEEMEENVYLTEFHAAKGHTQQIAELDNRFHEIMYEACNSKMLEKQLRDFHDYVLRLNVEQRYHILLIPHRGCSKKKGCALCASPPPRYSFRRHDLQGCI